MTLKIAIVGCGKIADGHVEEIQKMPELAEVVAVCDLEALMAEQIAVRYGIPASYGDLDTMLREAKPDVVHITTPPSSHLPIARACIEAGAHIYVEKPLTPDYPTSLELVRLAEERGKVLTVGYTYLFDPPALVMRDLMAQGELGDAVHVESFYGYNLEGQFGKALMSDGRHWVHGLPGKLFQNNIDHLVNKLVEFIPDEDPSILAFGDSLRTDRYGDDRDHMKDELRILFRGERVTAYGTFSSHIRPVGHFARVYGTKNTMHVDYVSRTVTMDQTQSLPSAIGRLVPAFTSAAQFATEGFRNVWRFAKADFHFFSGLHYLIRQYYRSILHGEPLPIPHRDILRITRWLDAVYEQVPQHGPQASAVQAAEHAGAEGQK